MLVSAAAHAPANHALSYTSPGMVSFFVDCLYANFSPTKITSLTRINTKSENKFQAKVLEKLFAETLLKISDGRYIDYISILLCIFRYQKYQSSQQKSIFRYDTSRNPYQQELTLATSFRWFMIIIIMQFLTLKVTNKFSVCFHYSKCFKFCVVVAPCIQACKKSFHSWVISVFHQNKFLAKAGQLISERRNRLKSKHAV